MATKTYTFEAENLPGCDVTLDLEYTYTFDPGKLNGAPEVCYPPEEDHSITPPKCWKGEVMVAYIKAAHAAIKKIEEDLIPQLLWENKPKQWMEEECEMKFAA